MIDWKEVQSEFIPDGSLIDIYVFDTDVKDWQSFLELIRSIGEKFEYRQDGEVAEFKWNAEQLFEDRKYAHDFTFWKGEISYHCHFFIQEEIELDVAPIEINCQERLNSVIELLASIGSHLTKTVALTPENAPEVPILLFKSPEVGVEHIIRT